MKIPQDLSKKMEMLCLDDEQWYTDELSSGPDILEHIREIALTGRTAIPWSFVQEKMPARIEYCVKTVANYQTRCLGADVDLSDGSEGRSLLNMIFDKILSFDDVPFTWRRFCELLYDPLRNYSNTMKYIRALYKVIDVQMTVTESQRLLRLQPKPLQSFTPICLFFDESNMTLRDRRRLRKDVEKAKKRALRYVVSSNRENEDITEQEEPTVEEVADSYEGIMAESKETIPLEMEYSCTESIDDLKEEEEEEEEKKPTLVGIDVKFAKEKHTDTVGAVKKRVLSEKVHPYAIGNVPGSRKRKLLTDIFEEDENNEKEAMKTMNLMEAGDQGEENVDPQFARGY